MESSMKKICFMLFCLFSFIAVNAANVKNEKVDEERTDEKSMVVVPMSSTEWEQTKEQVDKEGYCLLKEKNVLLVITNGCPSITYFLPIDLRINDNTLEIPELDEREDLYLYKEPLPYYWQSL